MRERGASAQVLTAFVCLNLARTLPVSPPLPRSPVLPPAGS